MKLEVGKRYVRRDGDITVPIMAAKGPQYPFTDGAEYWSPEGKYQLWTENHPRDLVAEYGASDELQSLVDKMNAGEKAWGHINEIGKSGFIQWRRNQKGGWVINSQSPNIEYRVKPAPKKVWHVFPVLGGLDVTVADDHLKIGCMTWPLQDAMKALRDALAGENELRIGKISRFGIDYDSHTLPWEEAQKIVDAVEEYLI